MMRQALCVERLSASYPSFQKAEAQSEALKNVSFCIDDGEKVALLGANGAGKSTLLLTLLGVLPHTSGGATVCGLNLEKKNLAAIRALAGLVFQNPDDQLFMPTILDDVLFGPLNYMKEKKHNAAGEEALLQKAESLLQNLGILRLKDRMSHKLSGGEKRLAALAAVLIMEPRLLLLDEPTAFLDPRGRRALSNIMLSLPHAALIATHDLEFAAKTTTRAIILSRGSVRADGRTSDILSDSALLEDCGL